MKSTSQLLALTCLIATVLPGGNSEHFTCFDTILNNVKVSVACVSNTHFTECNNNVISTSTIPEICRISPDAGGSLTNTFCYPRATNFNQICRAPPPACTKEGSFPVPDDNTCSYYYSCIDNGAGFSQSLLTCPLGQNFQTALQRCTSDVCNAIPSTTPAPTSTLPPYLTGPCIPLTRQADPNNCHNFYQCNIFGQRQKMTCPFNKRFDTLTGFCSFIANCGSRLLN